MKEHILRARDPILTGAGVGTYRRKLVFILYTHPSSNSKGSDMPNRL